MLEVDAALERAAIVTETDVDLGVDLIFITGEFLTDFLSSALFPLLLRPSSATGQSPASVSATLNNLRGCESGNL